MRKGKIHIGTSGWHYKHWTGTFYPENVKGGARFDEYLKSFDTVEINNSFYKLPEIKTFNNWRKAVPEKFIYAVKASRFITHNKKLIVDKNSLRKFFTHVDHLEDKLGPVLFQLPPKWRINTERLRLFLDALPEGYRCVFEFREHSWYKEEIYDLLKKNNCAFCIYELQHHLSPIEVTADFVYIRLHGPGNKYQGSYSDKTLHEWADQCRDWQKKGLDVYIYFDNDQEGYAAFNAVSLIEIIGK